MELPKPTRVLCIAFTYVSFFLAWLLYNEITQIHKLNKTTIWSVKTAPVRFETLRIDDSGRQRHFKVALGLTSSSSSWAAFIVELPIFFALDSSNAQNHGRMFPPRGTSSASDCRAWICMFLVDLLQGFGTSAMKRTQVKPKLAESQLFWHVLCFLHMFFSSILYRLYRLLCKYMRSMLWTQWKQECSTYECE